MVRTNILVIEDEEDIRELVKYNLQRENFGVLEAGSGEEGLKLVERTA
ncbi:MAG: two-component system, OmpR family, phosphate regulon response regulator PhoB, partial [Verrucomicrobiota bacterium]|nr:two-component system, OmpR family, phosphate regulon response regulator PhoB [Verrucomicrobiota bacterium]